VVTQAGPPLYSKNIFTASIFVAMGIPYILRKDRHEESPPRYKVSLYELHVWTRIGLLIAGFVVLNVLLINIGQAQVTIAGIPLLEMISLWYVSLVYFEGIFERGRKTAISSTVGPPGRPAFYQDKRTLF
jgi:hypothetical protein